MSDMSFGAYLRTAKVAHEEAQDSEVRRIQKEIGEEFAKAKPDNIKLRALGVELDARVMKLRASSAPAPPQPKTVPEMPKPDVAARPWKDAWIAEKEAHDARKRSERARIQAERELRRLMRPTPVGLLERRRRLGTKIEAIAETGRQSRLKRLEIKAAKANVRELAAEAQQAAQLARLAKQHRVGIFAAARQRKIVRLQTKETLKGLQKPVKVQEHVRGAPPRRGPRTVIRVTTISGASARAYNALGRRRRKGRRKGRRKR